MPPSGGIHSAGHAGADPVENLRVGATEAAERLGLADNTRVALRRRIDASTPAECGGNVLQLCGLIRERTAGGCQANKKSLELMIAPFAKLMISCAEHSDSGSEAQTGIPLWILPAMPPEGVIH